MISTKTRTLLDEIGSTFSKLPQNVAWRVAYGKASDIEDDPNEVIEAAYQRFRQIRSSRLHRLVEMDAPKVILDYEKEIVGWSKELWSKKSRIGITLKRVLVGR